VRYYKDSIDGTFPMAGAEPINDPRFVEITEAEWDELRQRGGSDAHPCSPHVLNRAAMEAAARDHIPPDGTRLPEPPPPETLAADGLVAAVIDEEVG